MNDMGIDTLGVRMVLYEASKQLKALVERDSAILQLQKICAPSQFKDVDLNALSISEIELTTEYLMQGESLSTALNYVQSYGWQGLEIYKFYKYHKKE
jgi:hypothetical protein